MSSVLFPINIVGALSVDRQFYPESSLETVLSGVACSGAESKLVECGSSMLPPVCPLQQTDAGVVCQDNATVRSNCSDGDIELRDGSNSLEGRVAVCLNGAWGTVCGNQFNQDVAEVICRQLGHITNGKNLAHINWLLILLLYKFDISSRNHCSSWSRLW